MRWFLPVLVVLGIGAGVLFFNAERFGAVPDKAQPSDSPARPAGEPSASARSPGSPLPAPTPGTGNVPSNRKRFALMFAEPDGRGLRPEPRVLPRPSTLRASIRQLLEALIEGSRTGLGETLPRSTRVLEIFLDGQGTVYVDFSKEISTDHPGGVWAEVETVASVVQTLTVNFESIRKVAFLMEGKTVETLAGHVDIRRPLTRLDARAMPVAEEVRSLSPRQPAKP